MALVIGVLAYNWHNHRISEEARDEELGTFALASYKAACLMAPWEPTLAESEVYDFELTGRVLARLSAVDFDRGRLEPAPNHIESEIADRWLKVYLLMASALRTESWAQIDEIDVTWYGRDYGQEMKDLGRAWANAVRPIMEDPANRTSDWFDACMRISEFSIDLE
ncbi:MAG: hypothetical protein P1T08_17435 [Acidimicrobiia bacterium]|nr:hypothetical protein [Acidimicrobiia bacterium]